MLKMEVKEKTDDEWILAVQSSLDDEFRPDKSQNCLIHTVPNSLLREDTKVFYHPQGISFGPYHFQIKDPKKDDIELLKSEVARKAHRKIHSKGGLQSVIEKFMGEEAQRGIKESYAKEFKLSSEVCAWMIVRDACFVLEVLHRFREDEDAEKSRSASSGSTLRRIEENETEKKVSAFMDSILSRKRHHPLLTEIVKDMLKMENQLPFWALEKIRLDIVGSTNELWFESALKNLSPIEVAEAGNREYNKESHILQLLHDYIVDRQVNSLSGQSARSLFDMMLFLCLESFDMCTPEKCVKCLYIPLLLLLSPVFVLFFIWVIIFAIWYCIKIYIFPKKEKIEKHVPTVEELKRVGVKFKKLEGDKIGISHIKFTKSNSTLYLPKFNVDNRSEVIIRNLIALEICSQEEQKPITRYAILMNDLINTSGDVGILRREDIITSKLGSDDEIAQLWNSVVTATEMPNYGPIDEVSLSINHYRKKWWKVLWAQFLMVHCSKPWLFLSLLAGLILLLLTLIQVICLFEPCQLK